MYQDERKLDFKPLGIAIKKAREAKGWTQEYLAQLVDLTPRSIMYIENRGQHPRLNKFYLITTLLDISVDQFFFPCNEDGDNNRRKQVDVLLNDMEEKALIVDDVTDCPTFCAALAYMKRHDSCSCHNASSSPNTKAATQRIFIVEVTAFCHYAHLCNGVFMFFYYSKIQPAHRLLLPDYYPGRSQQPDLWLIAPPVLLRTE